MSELRERLLTDPPPPPGAQQVHLLLGLSCQLRGRLPVISASPPDLRRQRVHPRLLPPHIACHLPGGGADSQVTSDVESGALGPYSHSLLQKSHSNLIFRRCVQCSLRYCLNSWCKEESVLVQLSIITVASQSLVYIPVLEALANKLNLEGDYIPLIGCVSPVEDHTTL